MDKIEFKQLLKEDRDRFSGYIGSTIISWWVTSNYRKGRYYYTNRSKLLFNLLYKIHRGYYFLIKLITGIQLPIEVDAKGGLLFPHYSYIVFAAGVKIGKSCTIHQGCTLGMAHYGKKKGSPIIGDNVVIFPNCNITGNIHIGNNVVIGANSVVTHDVPDNCVVAGSPAKIITDNCASSLGVEGREIYWRS